MKGNALGKPWMGRRYWDWPEEGPTVAIRSKSIHGQNLVLQRVLMEKKNADLP